MGSLSVVREGTTGWTELLPACSGPDLGLWVPQVDASLNLNMSLRVRVGTWPPYGGSVKLKIIRRRVEVNEIPGTP